MFRRGFLTVLAGVTACVLGVLSTASAAPTRGPDVRISELANGGPGGSTDEIIELTNFGDEPADLDGWAIYRCIGVADRFRNPQVPEFSGVTLGPGETYLIAHPNSTVADLADRTDVISGLADAGFGMVLEDSQRRIVDAVAVYPYNVQSECGSGMADNLPNNLDFRRGQSYQRTGTSGDLNADFIKAARTPNSPNATDPDPGVQPSDVLVSELTNGGPAGSSDNFIELANFGEQPVDISGWEVYRCRAPGRRRTSYLQVTVPPGVVLEPGNVFVAAHESVDVPDGVDHARYETSLANVGFGALIEDVDGNVMDAVGVFETDGIHEAPKDSPCTQGTALPNRLDYGFDETYQRFQSTGDNAADFVKAARTLGDLVIHDPDDFPEPDPFEHGPVRVSELTHAGPGGAADDFFELANFGDEPVSLQGWTVHRCQANGRRAPEPQFPPIGDVTLQPGETFLAVHEDSPLRTEGEHDAVYAEGFSSEQFGLIVYAAAGEVVDSVGVDHADTDSITYIACTMGVALTNDMLHRAGAGESFQRFRATGSNVEGFVPAPRTPGELDPDLRAPADIPEDELQPVDVDPAPRPIPSSLVAPTNGASDIDNQANLRVTAEHTTGEDVEVTFRGAERISVHERATQAFTGISSDAPPASRRPEGETRVPSQRIPLEPTADPLVTEATEGFPYQRYRLLLDDRPEAPALEVAWSGRSVGGNELQLYAWNHDERVWELLDAAADEGDITLIGTVDVASAVRGRVIDVLVQDGPATQEAFSDDAGEPNAAFKEPNEYDFAFAHLSDTQYVAQRYRDVYADMIGWLVTRQDARKIDYTIHTGDIIQQWFGDHLESRARDEFQFASDVMGLLEDAGHAYGVTPGNHDNRKGVTNDLYNEYFGPDRYEGQPWFGGSWRPNENENHYDVVEVGGAKFLMVYLGYFGGIDESPDEALDWANQVIADHPDHNVIMATHDYLLPDGSLSTRDTESAVCGSGGTSQCNRWNHLGDRYWQDVVLPNENVFLVLAGHRHAVAMNIKRDVGGVEGRTVVEMLADYSFHERDGRRGDTGFLRLLQFDVDAKTVAVNTYSPTLEDHNAWEYDPQDRYDDSDDEFTIEVDINDVYDKRVETDLIAPQTPARTIGTQHVAAGSDATVTWEDLEARTTYGWYAEARDESGAVAISPVWTFSTARRPR